MVQRFLRTVHQRHVSRIPICQDYVDSTRINESTHTSASKTANLIIFLAPIRIHKLSLATVYYSIKPSSED